MIADHVKLNIINDNRFVKTCDDLKELLEVDYYDINDYLYSSGKINTSLKPSTKDHTHFLFIFTPNKVNIENIVHLTKLSIIDPSKVIIFVQYCEIHKGEIIEFDNDTYTQLHNVVSVMMRNGVKAFASIKSTAEYINSLSKTYNKVEHHSV